MPETAPITIVFTDLVGSAELDRQFGDDRALELRRRHFRLIREAVTMAGGHEVKNLGDGLMLTFGSAVDGLGAAVDIQQRVHRLNLGPDATEMQVRVGVNVGEAIQSEEDYFGLQVNVARRLCDVADAGQILTTALVRDLVGSRGDFGFADIGSRSLRGLTATVDVCEVTWRKAGDEPFPLPRELEAPTRSQFVGRESQLAQLREGWARSVAGERQLMLVSGEPGIGKSRLVREFAAHPQAEGATVLFGRCNEEAVLPYQPFVEAVRGYIERSSASHLRTTLGTGSGELVRLVPELSDRLPGLTTPLLGEPETERYRLFQAIARLLVTISRTSPALLIVDDLHWADRPTLLVLRHIIGAADPSSLMILATYRDVEVDRRHPLTQVLADIRREAPVLRVPLEGLSRDEVRAFLDLAAQQELESRADTLAEAIHRETEGNPLFIEEIIRHLVESGRVYRHNGAWASDATSIGDLGIPETIRDVVARRLGALSAECGRVLSTASVLGREFDLRELQRVADLPMAELLEVLADADEAQVILAIPGRKGQFSFAHSLVRQALYEDLGDTGRLRLHQRAAEALENLYSAEPDEHLPQLAHHFLAAAPAGEVEKAVDYAIAAGQRSTRLLAYEEALGHYSAALDTLGPKSSDAGRRCRLLLGLGDAQIRSGDPITARETFATAADLARDLGSAELLAEAALGFGGWTTFGDVGTTDEPLVAMLEETLAALPPGPSPERCRATARLAIELYWRNEPERRQRLAEDAIAMARQLDDPALLAYALTSAGFAIWGPATTEQRIDLGDQIISLASEPEDIDLRITGYNYRAAGLLELGRVEEAYGAIETMHRLAEESGAPGALWQSLSYKALIAILQGRLDEGETLAASAFAMGQNIRPQVAIHSFSGQLFSVRYNQGRLDELEATAVASAEEAEGLLVWRSALSLLYAEIGKTDEARRELQIFVDANFDNLSLDAQYISALSTLAEACVRIGAAEPADRLHELLKPYRERVVVLGWGSLSQSSVAYHLALTDLLRERWDEAIKHLDRALDIHARLGATPWTARAQVAYARALHGRGAEGDQDRAAGHLAAAGATAEELGLGYIRAEVEELTRVRPA